MGSHVMVVMECQCNVRQSMPDILVNTSVTLHEVPACDELIEHTADTLRVTPAQMCISQLLLALAAMPMNTASMKQPNVLSQLTAHLQHARCV